MDKTVRRALKDARDALDKALAQEDVAGTPPLPDTFRNGDVVAFKRVYSDGSVYTFVALKVNNLWYSTALNQHRALLWHELVDTTHPICWVERPIRLGWISV